VDDIAAPAMMGAMARSAGDDGFEEMFLAEFRGIARAVRHVAQDDRLAEEITPDAFVTTGRTCGRNNAAVG
jgi:hypothetical protein